MKNVYHYTKGYCVGQIIMGQEILPMTIPGQPGERFVWLTREETYPKSALPAIPELPETLMVNQLKVRQEVDLLKVAKETGGIWRFVFERAKHPEIKVWQGSYQRNRLVKRRFGALLEQTARQVGDQVELWAFATDSLPIANSTLQQLTRHGWKDLLHFSQRHGEPAVIEEFDGAKSKKIILDSMKLRKVLVM